MRNIYHRMNRLLRPGIWLTLELLCLLALSVPVQWEVEVFAAAGVETDIKPNVFTPHNEPIGAVDLEGRIFALYGNQIGSVDASGNVYNVSHILIGKVDPEGNVFNQATPTLVRLTVKEMSMI
jgi:hypothetical protein